MVLGVCRRALPDPGDADDAFQATFLILIRKARTLARPELLAGWLYGVAFRVARKAKLLALSRRGREMPMPEAPVPDPTDRPVPFERMLESWGAITYVLNIERARLARVVVTQLRPQHDIAAWLPGYTRGQGGVEAARAGALALEVVKKPF